MLDNLRRVIIGGHYFSNIWLNVARRIGSVITKGHTTLLFCPITMIDALLTGINEYYKLLYSFILINFGRATVCSSILATKSLSDSSVAP